MLVPRKNGMCAKAHVDEAVNDPDNVVVTETPWVISVTTGEELYADHVLNGRMGTFHFSID